MAKLNDLSEATAISDDDIVHLRTTGGIDKKIFGSNLRSSLVDTVVTVSSTMSLNLASYTTGLTLVGAQTGAIVITLTNALPIGKTLKIVNGSSSDFDYVLDSETIALTEDCSIDYISNGSKMIEMNTTYKKGALYHQSAGMGEPSDLSLAGTWSNWTNRAVLYDVSLTSGGTSAAVITREEANNSDLDDDLVYDDQIVDGTYDNYYVIEVITFIDKFERVEGTLSNAYNDTYQLDAGQAHDHRLWSSTESTTNLTANPDRTPSQNRNSNVDDEYQVSASGAIAATLGKTNTPPIEYDGNGEPRTAEETRVLNLTKRIWKRIA